jgi:hypothetical protein
LKGWIKTPYYAHDQVRKGYLFVFNLVPYELDTMEEDLALSAEKSGSIEILRCTYCDAPAKQIDSYFPYDMKHCMCVKCLVKHSKKDCSDEL